MTRLVALYPRDWRARYEAEFLALIADRPPDPLGRLDIVRGAVDARLHPQVGGTPNPVEPLEARSPWSARVGWLTLAGGLVWMAAMVIAINGPVVVDAWGTYRDVGAALPFWSVAILLLGAGMLAVTLELPETARIARAAAYVSGLVGLLWAFAPWFLYAGLIAFVGLLVVAVSAWRTGRWYGLEVALLAIGVCLPWGLAVAYMLGLWTVPEPDLDGQFYVYSLLTSAWVVVGVSLVRPPRGRPAPIDRLTA